MDRGQNPPRRRSADEVTSPVTLGFIPRVDFSKCTVRAEE
jgi:hypothetical protein